MPLSEEAARIQAAVDRMAIRPFNHFKIDEDTQVYETAQGAASAAFRKEIERQLRTLVAPERTPGITAEAVAEIATVLDEHFSLFMELFKSSNATRLHYNGGA